MVAQTYDGTSSLGKALAELYKFSPKNQTKIAEKIKQAKEAIGIPFKFSDKGRLVSLTLDERAAIWQWHLAHYEQLVSSSCYTSDDGETLHYTDGSTEKYLGYGNFLYTKADGSGEFTSDWGDVELSPISEYPDNLIERDSDERSFELDQFKRIAFYTKENNVRVRKVIALELYYLEPLAVAVAMCCDNSVPEWLETITDGWEEKKTTTSLTRFVKHAIYQNQK